MPGILLFNKKVIYLRTENETGLIKGGDVRIKGYKIGTIDDIVLTKDFQSLIKLSFDENIPFPADSRFTI
ncbi:MlaD family protein, partial [Klebsiella variicola]|uniref:MlaD family protein n=1 Tax=Klebsiella variicola TaxID=244366 RepID=UPI00214F02F9